MEKFSILFKHVWIHIFAYKRTGDTLSRLRITLTHYHVLLSVEYMRSMHPSGLFVMDSSDEEVDLLLCEHTLNG
jgi:hypothetical protein